LFSNLLAENDLEIMTPFPDSSPRKYLEIQHLRRPVGRQTDEKVIKIRISFDTHNSSPLRRLWQKNFRAPRVSRCDILPEVPHAHPMTRPVILPPNGSRKTAAADHDDQAGGG
jgi:hypothetical protein